LETTGDHSNNVKPLHTDVVQRVTPGVTPANKRETDDISNTIRNVLSVVRDHMPEQQNTSPASCKNAAIVNHSMQSVQLAGSAQNEASTCFGTSSVNALPNMSTDVNIIPKSVVGLNSQATDKVDISTSASTLPGQQNLQDQLSNAQPHDTGSFGDTPKRSVPHITHLTQAVAANSSPTNIASKIVNQSPQTPGFGSAATMQHQNAAYPQLPLPYPRHLPNNLQNQTVNIRSTLPAYAVPSQPISQAYPHDVPTNQSLQHFHNGITQPMQGPPVHDIPSQQTQQPFVPVITTQQDQSRPGYNTVIYQRQIPATTINQNSNPVRPIVIVPQDAVIHHATNNQQYVHQIRQTIPVPQPKTNSEPPKQLLALTPLAADVQRAEIKHHTDGQSQQVRIES
jgi:hypothetical protein